MAETKARPLPIQNGPEVCFGPAGNCGYIKRCQGGYFRINC